MSLFQKSNAHNKLMAAAVDESLCSPLAMDVNEPSDPPPPPSLTVPSSSTTIMHLPEEIIHHIFSHLPLRQIILSLSVSKFFLHVFTSPSFLALRPPLPLLALRQNRHHLHNQISDSTSTTTTILHAFDPSLEEWLRFPLSFLPFPSSFPITASPSLLYLWAETDEFKQSKSLVMCNPLSRSFRVLPALGSAWSRHGTVLVGNTGHVVILSKLAALFYCPGGDDQWMKFSLNLPSKPRSPVLVGDTVYVFCDIGSPWRSQWKLFFCRLADLGRPRGWDRLERVEWGDFFDVLKRPRLIRGRGEGSILIVGELRSIFVGDAPCSCSTILILRLNLRSMEWGESGRMPSEMYQCFGLGSVGGSKKVKVFGGDGMVWFSGKKVKGKIAMWTEEDEVVGRGSGGCWRWVENVPGHGDGAYRGFTFNASITAAP